MTLRNWSADLLQGFLKFGVLFICFAYILTGVVNYFVPISIAAALSVIFFAGICAWFFGRNFSLKTFEIKEKLSMPFDFRFAEMAILLILIIWAFIIFRRPVIGDDENIYHFPLALLMNFSRWYPGIGRINLAMAYTNGHSVLASLFTSSGIPGFENIFNYLIWLLFWAGLLLFMLKKGIKLFTALSVSAVFLLQPVMFWQSYNLASDMPAACFITLGLLALTERNFQEALLFMSMASAIKATGLAALFFTVLYYLIFNIIKKEKIVLTLPVALLSFAIVAVSLTRLFVATGNPLYPLVPINLAGWGMSVSEQKTYVLGPIVQCSGVVRSLSEVPRFLINFTIFPKRMVSNYWFFPFTGACLLGSFWAFAKKENRKDLDLHKGYVALMVAALFAVWFIGSPLFRFAAGLFIFVTLILFLYCQRRSLPILLTRLIQIALFGTLVVFVADVGKHIKEDVLPFLKSPKIAYNQLVHF